MLIPLDEDSPEYALLDNKAGYVNIYLQSMVTQTRHVE